MVTRRDSIAFLATTCVPSTARRSRVSLAVAGRVFLLCFPSRCCETDPSSLRALAPHSSDDDKASEKPGKLATRAGRHRSVRSPAAEPATTGGDDGVGMLEKGKDRERASCCPLVPFVVAYSFNNPPHRIPFKQLGKPRTSFGKIIRGTRIKSRRSPR
jgi:hypothetical protein